ncbi:MoaD/ThiS family protein [Candidatus Cyanaurora vandensis]|uniref:MoaD/ThiS family protein n=1 Tax=Candidatus Cyanaurora vandensis TaxID=2714958 RepID=UPI00257A5405|nr:MoaD/ThiS family protein [Candidatus Cyanaurora vandensis]
MEITLKLFAAYREALDTDEQVLQVESESTVGQVLQSLVTQHPTLSRWVPVTRFAVNQNFVPAAWVLQPGDELVFIPPVSGG